MPHLNGGESDHALPFVPSQELDGCRLHERRVWGLRVLTVKNSGKRARIYRQ
ncbi:hypothetical protein [Xaviernesmea oryzae]|uniref:hypothetical protein n=1 Tax=Xaviernesmea oryzae TaxID=464029 RepID=UPI0008B4F99D|nr:hypothetical protein [Xaviernesmea oryzae]SEM39487.1 hypothetical protein SAMN04487976_1392 [Xaviernesmea oryzae]